MTWGQGIFLYILVAFIVSFVLGKTSNRIFGVVEITVICFMAAAWPFIPLMLFALLGIALGMGKARMQKHSKAWDKEEAAPHPAKMEEGR